MSIKHRTLGNPLVNCPDCDDTVIKKASGEYCCTSCNYVPAKPSLKRCVSKRATDR